MLASKAGSHWLRRTARMLGRKASIKRLRYMRAMFVSLRLTSSAATRPTKSRTTPEITARLLSSPSATEWESTSRP